MKKILFLISIIVVSTNVFSQKLLVEANNDFSFKIYKATKPDSNNFFISPFSLNIALSIVNEGAKNTTRKEIDNLLSLKNINNRTLEYKKLIQKTINLEDSDSKNDIYSENETCKDEIFLANSLWVNDSFYIDINFIANIKDNYQSEVFRFNKNNLIYANSQLKKWISEKTNNKISEIKGINENIMLSIVNAIYFMGEWEKPFDIKKTKVKKFYTLNREKIEIKYMRDQAHYRYYEDSDIQAVYLPYKCHHQSMIVILPQKRYGILDIENELDKQYLNKIDSLNYLHEVILSLPKFKIESEIYPKNEIIEMGYPVMFSDKADFNGISNKDSLKIGEIIHKTFIEIDEKKTEASAVTKADVIIIGYGGGGDPPPPPPPKIFNADHPFIFLIMDNRTKAILFTGRFVKE